MFCWLKGYAGLAGRVLNR